MQPDQDDQQLAQQWFDRKSQLMEASLGKEHDMVMHAMIPYGIGGALDLYYYPQVGDERGHSLRGTAIATKELCELPNEGSRNDYFGCYELVMFTKHRLDLDAANDPSSPFGQTHAAINGILNLIARYSEQATLNPLDTCEFPADMEELGGRCLIFDAYDGHSDDMVEGFGLMAVIEIFRSEMAFAQEHGGDKLIERLKACEHYPYCDLDREPVA
jgi:hypothetical protein